MPHIPYQFDAHDRSAAELMNVVHDLLGFGKWNNNFYLYSEMGQNPKFDFVRIIKTLFVKIVNFTL